MHDGGPIQATITALLASARKKEAELLATLHIIEARLGTPGEQPNDIEAAREIAHRLVSIACVELLAQMPGRMPED